MDATNQPEMGMMKGIVMCQACKHHQPWASKGQNRHPKTIATSNCHKCGKRNRFYPNRFRGDGKLTETRGRKPAVYFRRRPEWTIHLQMASESRARNRGSIVDEDELMFQETEEFKDRVQKRIEELEEIKEALE
jgi:membrane protease subunit (stomatin/prohibitin family)